MDKISYALGLSIGNNFQNSGINNLQVEDFVKGLKDVLSDQKGQQGDLVIPVYLGNQLLDEVIVTAQQRMSLRSGGR